VIAGARVTAGGAAAAAIGEDLRPFGFLARPASYLWLGIALVGGRRWAPAEA
jgi:hypothetical protein